MFGFLRRESRSAAPNLSDIQVTQSAPNFFEMLFGVSTLNSSGETVTIETALGVPAILCAVEFLSKTMASLPLEVREVQADGTEKEVSGAIAEVLGEFVNDEMTSYDWRKYTFEQVLTVGRGLTFIDRNGRGDVIGLYALDPYLTMIRRSGGQLIYSYNDLLQVHEYGAQEIIDVPFMLWPNMVRHRSPIALCNQVIGMAQAITKYGGAYFRSGGVPPFAVTGKFQSSAAMQRARDDFEKAVASATKESRQALVLPDGLEIKSIGADPEKSQMIDTQRWMVEQIARIYQLPPSFLQDLTHGTFSNVEQQDLQLAKHAVSHWATAFEKQMTLKIFGRGSKMKVRMNLDGLQRGDFATRTTGYATAIQSGQMTPNEVRRANGRAAMTGGDSLMIQGATMPLANQVKNPPPGAPGVRDGGTNGQA